MHGPQASCEAPAGVIRVQSSRSGAGSSRPDSGFVWTCLSVSTGLASGPTSFSPSADWPSSSTDASGTRALSTLGSRRTTGTTGNRSSGGMLSGIAGSIHSFEPQAGSSFDVGSMRIQPRRPPALSAPSLPAAVGNRARAPFPCQVGCVRRNEHLRLLIHLKHQGCRLIVNCRTSSSSRSRLPR